MNFGWNMANKSNHVIFRLIAPNHSLDQCCNLYSKKKPGLLSPRWKHHTVSVDLWWTKDGRIQVLHWLFPHKGVWSKSLHRYLSSNLFPSVADPQTILWLLCAAWSTVTPMTSRATLCPSTSLPTSACLCQPSGISFSQRVRKGTVKRSV